MYNKFIKSCFVCKICSFFKRMAVELSEAMGSVSVAAAELGLMQSVSVNGAQVLINLIFEKS